MSFFNDIIIAFRAAKTLTDPADALNYLIRKHLSKLVKQRQCQTNSNNSDQHNIFSPTNKKERMGV